MTYGAAQRTGLPGNTQPGDRVGQWHVDADVNQTGRDRVVTDAGGCGIHMTIEAPDAVGDGTVPAAASAAQIASYDGCQAGYALTGFDHQNDYNNETVRDVLLDAIVRLIEPVEVGV